MIVYNNGRKSSVFKNKKMYYGIISENGTYLGMDLGGTNFRILRVDMNGDDVKTVTKYYELQKSLLTGPSAGVRNGKSKSTNKGRKLKL